MGSRVQIYKYTKISKLGLMGSKLGNYEKFSISSKLGNVEKLSS